MYKVFLLLLICPALLLGMDDDPLINHHVNVLTGDLHLVCEDHVVQSARPIALQRVYTGSRANHFKHPKWGFAVGWSFFPQVHLQLNKIDGGYEAEISEPYGGTITYVVEHKWEELMIMKPKVREGENSLSMNYRSNSNNNRLHFDRKNGVATLYLANGGKRHYQAKERTRTLGEKIKGHFRGLEHEYYLWSEKSPSKTSTLFLRSENNRECVITKYSSDTNKFFSTIKMQRLNKSLNFKIKATCGDGKVVNYFGKILGKGSLLSSIDIDGRPKEDISYTENNTTSPNRIEDISLDGNNTLKVTYAYGGKVMEVFENGVKTASFSYTDKTTEVRDCENILSRYHHENSSLTKIERFDKEEKLYSTTHYIWKEGKLSERKICDTEGDVVYSKQYFYDKWGNLIQETLLDGYSKWYRYDEKHMLIEEKDIDDVITQFAYLDDSDLPISKKTVHNGVVLLEETYIYDQNFLLIEKRCFDGYRESRESYLRDPKSGMIIEKDNGLQKTFYEYDSSNRVIKESTEFASISMEYDRAGRMTCKTFPLGGQNHTVYDKWGNPIEIKEVGFPHKYIKYDKFHRPISCRMSNRESRSVYDQKGRIILEIDYKGAETRFYYDAFGRCIKKILPMVPDETGEDYHPEILYAYDIAGNCISETAPDGAITKTSYNISGKPLETVFADGSTTTNIYYINGDLKQTTDQGGGVTTFEYDPLHRLVKSKKGEFEELWEYEGVFLKTHTNQRGLVTTYQWDEFGRKISETLEDRKKEFFYNEQGFLEEVKEGDIYTIHRFDIEGNIIETSQNGFNKITYEYDLEGRKTRAIKMTSQGEAIDQFFYNDESELILHIDPKGGESHIVYEDYKRTAIDQMGNRTVETFDRLYRIIQTEKQTPAGETLLQEQFFFDRAGNIRRRLTKDPCLEVFFTYDVMGRLIEQVEAGKKRTTFEYDSKGRLLCKTDPNGISIYHTYDHYDRLVQKKSSDGTIGYQYFYTGLDLAIIKDMTNDELLFRTYTKFGEVARETSFSGLATSWFYDTFGRKKQITLPDGSFILYSYKENCMTAVSRLDKNGNLLYKHQYTAFDANCHVEEEELPFGIGTTRSERDLLERAYLLASPAHTIELGFSAASLVTRQNNSLTGNKDYEYDALAQLSKEGDEDYDFDSIGNPKDFEVDDLNQIVSEDFSYDLNGNLVRRKDREYKYDALNRLVEIRSAQKTITYTYDPLSRLCSIEENGTTTYFLYDGPHEIGTMSINGSIKQLKILGLGIQGDIGAAIAIEISGKTYVPLHDLQGNIIAILDRYGRVVESYRSNAFGEEKLGKFINPWRFSSKRSDQHLVFFGCRFYDPSLKRWLTPDPLGFEDSRNLYAYVRTSPLNRLDEFGLNSFTFTTPYKVTEDPTYGRSYEDFLGMQNSYPTYNRPDSRPYWVNKFPQPRMDFPSPTCYEGRGLFSHREIEIMIICSRKYELPFTDDEVKNGYFNFLDYLPCLLAGVKDKIAIVTYQNGINTSKEEFIEQGKRLANIFPQGTLIIGIYNPTHGISKDIKRTFDEKKGLGSDTVDNLRVIDTYLIDIMSKYCPESKCLHIAHSEAGVIYNRSFERMNKEYQEKMRQYFYVVGIGPAESIPRDHGVDAWNYYSTHDAITGIFASKDGGRYNVEWVKSITPMKDRTAYFADHAFKGATYQGVIKNNVIKKVENTLGGFYVGTNR